MSGIDDLLWYSRTWTGHHQSFHSNVQHLDEADSSISAWMNLCLIEDAGQE